MRPETLRQMFRPLFGLERRSTVARFLYAILICALIVTSGLIAIRLMDGEDASKPTIALLSGFFFLALILLFAVKRGYVNTSALAFIFVTWVSVTYHAWMFGGVHDVIVYVYIFLILLAALLTTLPVSLLVSLLSVVAIWVMAISEMRGWRIADIDSPFSAARDLTAILILVNLLGYLVVTTVNDSLDSVREEEKKFRKIFHLSPVAIAIASLEEGRLLDANDAYWRLTGFDAASAIGKTTVELGLRSSYVERAKLVEELKKRKSIHDPAYKLINRFGEEHPSLAFYELTEFQNEPALIAMFYDMTDQKRAELSLKASEQKYRSFVEQSMEGIWFLMFDQPIPTSLPEDEQANLIYERGYIAESNDVFARMYGYASNTEMRGMRLLDLQVDEELKKQNMQSALKMIREGYRSGNRETWERTRSGQVVTFMNNSVGILEDGNLIGVWGSQLDITALKNTEDALRRSEARTRALLAAIPDTIFEIKEDGTILQFISSTSESPLPSSPEQLVGKTLREVLPAAADQASFAIERVLRSGQVHAFEYQTQQGAEKRTLEARLSPLGTDSVLAIVRDVSLQQWIRGEREKLITELESKNAELERFTYTVSHDLKSPLITIKGFLGFMGEDAKRGNLERLESDIQRVSDAADRMQRLLNDLLELSRIGRLVNQPKSVDLNQMILEVCDLLQGRIDASNIKVNVQEHLPTVYGDQPRLFEVFQNLIDNACKFMGDQTSPTVEIGEAGTAEDGNAILFIRDNGIGIEPRFKDRIFGLFDKLDPHTEGTGIGLALVKRIIEFHEGRIWVESEPQNGSTFYFTLPMRKSGIPT